MSSQVLGGEVERERDRRRLRLEERRALVADVRRPDRARGQDVVGERRGRCRPRSARTSPSARRLVEPEDHRVDGELHRGAGAERRRGGRPRFARASRTGRARSRSAASPPTMIVSLPARGERDAARHRARRGRPRRGARTASAQAERDRGGTVLMSTRTVPAGSARERRRPARRRRRRPPRSSASIEIATSAAATAVGRPVRDRAPRARRPARCGRVGVRFQSTSSRPAARERAAIALAHPARPEDGRRSRTGAAPVTAPRPAGA